MRAKTQRNMLLAMLIAFTARLLVPHTLWFSGCCRLDCLNTLTNGVLFMIRSSRRFQYWRIGGLVLALALTALPAQARRDERNYRRPPPPPRHVVRRAPPRHIVRRPAPRYYDNGGSDVGGVIAGALLGLVVGSALSNAAAPPSPPTVIYEQAPPPLPPPTVIYQQPGYYSQPGY